MRELTVNWLSVLADKALDAIGIVALRVPMRALSEVRGMWSGLPRGTGARVRVAADHPGRCWRVVCGAGAQGGDRDGV